MNIQIFGSKKDNDTKKAQRFLLCLFLGIPNP